MPRVSDVYSGSYLKAEDLQGGSYVVTIASSHLRMVGEEGQQEQRITLNFNETDKELVLNQTNANLLTSMFGTDDSDHWHGRQIELYVDNTVQYKGRTVPGLRVRAPSHQGPLGSGNGQQMPQQQQPQQPMPQQQMPQQQQPQAVGSGVPRQGQDIPF